MCWSSLGGNLNVSKILERKFGYLEQGEEFFELYVSSTKSIHEN